MPAKITTVDNDMEHRIAIGLVTSDEVLSHVVPMVRGSRYAEELFRSRAVATVYRWCAEYHERYDTAPGRSIQDVYESESSRTRMNADLRESVGELLAKLSKRFEDGEDPVANPDHLVDEAELYLRGRAVDLVREDLANCRTSGKLDQAEELIAQFRRPGRLATNGIDPLVDEETVREAFESSPEPLVRLPGALGRMMNEHLVREGFVAFMGPEKRGKTFCLTELAYRSLVGRRNVALFAVGDMSLRQMTLRFHVRVAGKNYRSQYCDPYCAAALDCRLNQDDACSREERTCSCGLPESCMPTSWAGRSVDSIIADAPDDYRACSACRRSRNSSWQPATWWTLIDAVEPLTWQEGMDAAERLRRRTKGRRLMLAAFPNNTVSINDLDRQLDAWERYENFVPDVIIIDYADILAPIDGRKEYRHQQNETWMAMRRMSEERRALVATATQTDAASYSTRILSLDNFSEDKRKYGHVTAMFGLNQSADEKRWGLFRINTVLVREGECDVHRCVRLLQDLRRGRFFTDGF